MERHNRSQKLVYPEDVRYRSGRTRIKAVKPSNDFPGPPLCHLAPPLLISPSSFSSRAFASARALKRGLNTPRGTGRIIVERGRDRRGDRDAVLLSRVAQAAHNRRGALKRRGFYIHKTLFPATDLPASAYESHKPWISCRVGWFAHRGWTSFATLPSILPPSSNLEHIIDCHSFSLFKGMMVFQLPISPTCPGKVEDCPRRASRSARQIARLIRCSPYDASRKRARESNFIEPRGNSAAIPVRCVISVIEYSERGSLSSNSG